MNENLQKFIADKEFIEKGCPACGSPIRVAKSSNGLLSKWICSDADCMYDDIFHSAKINSTLICYLKNKVLFRKLEDGEIYMQATYCSNGETWLFKWSSNNSLFHSLRRVEITGSSLHFVP
jgi:ssDNA-binding Zn-finger/Zn-ribbon topoisomerase 1